MSARSFFDTNILVYTDDHDAKEKQAMALDLIEEERENDRGVVSTQVLQEYFVSVTKKLGVTASIARRKVELFSRFHLIVVQLEDVLGAIDLHRLHHLSFWDALIFRAAQTAGCSTLYSEDFQDGQVIDGLRVVNPFKRPKRK